MQEVWVQSLDREDPLEKGKATHSSILAWRIPWTIHGVAKSRTRLGDFHFHVFLTQFLVMVMLTSFKTALSTISPPGHRHGCSQDAGHFHPHKGPSSCPFLATPTPFPPSPHCLPWLLIYPRQSRIYFLNVTFGIVDFFPFSIIPWRFMQVQGFYPWSCYKHFCTGFLWEYKFNFSRINAQECKCYMTVVCLVL